MDTERKEPLALFFTNKEYNNRVKRGHVVAIIVKDLVGHRGQRNGRPPWTKKWKATMAK